ncbi:MOSC domain-containing protein [Paenibacillus cremeus]|uniref:MOSC domain-containing protein n=1 Tax=Paenibacillus cremeus TaxID=2163881 RepID=A0A559KI38_9BACL|nr:MOSC domain-containing protein [Paenibacillus cremeus]TVY11791.1 MOSC domain-containing protein [Paenibacillus cremeus]
MKAVVGEIREINRYPVKSMAGERLQACTVESYGLYGDRFCAFYVPAKTGWKSFITARTLPELLSYKAQLIGGQVRVLTPDGKDLGWDDDLLRELQRLTPKRISMKSYGAPHPEAPELMSVDSASILIVTDRTLQQLEALWGKRLDPRRFRANLVVALDQDAMSEGDWIGKRLAVGSAELQVDTYCERCVMITVDPDTLERDASLLRIVNEKMDLTFGVYASVKKTGDIQAGDQVILVD